MLSVQQEEYNQLAASPRDATTATSRQSESFQCRISAPSTSEEQLDGPDRPREGDCLSRLVPSQSVKWLGLGRAPEECPPCFAAQRKDDPVNSVLFLSLSGDDRRQIDMDI